MTIDPASELREKRRLLEIEAERWWAWKMTALVSARDFGAAAMRSLILLNGAALIALASYMGSLASTRGWLISAESENVGFVATCYLIGLLSATIATGVAYINYTSIAESFPAPHGLTQYVEHGDASSWRHSIGRIAGPSAWLALFLAITSVLAFSLGSFSAVKTVVRIASGV
jgi:hypothetical protein